MNYDKIKELANEAGFLEDMFGFGIWDSEEFHKFAELVAKNIDSEAIRLIQFIANDYCELSHEKIKWQRDDHMKLCRRFLRDYIENNNERTD